MQASYSKMPARIDLGDVTPTNVKHLRKLNAAVFPVPYSAKFYKDVLKGDGLAKLAFFNDSVVGAVCCHEEACPAGKKLYILTLGCLLPFRRLGVGTLLLEHVFQICRARGISSISLHVQVSNEDALAFYRKFGFEIVERKPGYYRRIDPPDAFVLQRDTIDLLAE